ncbi:hypothetical protein [Paenibacillus sp. CMAA1364]
MLENSSDGTFGGKDEASSEFIASGAFEAARMFEETKPLEVSGGEQIESDTDCGIEGDSVDLSKIRIIWCNSIRSWTAM